MTKVCTIHLKMLSHDFPFDTMQMPLNCLDTTFRSFETGMLPKLNRRGIAALGMKSLGGNGEPVREGAVVVTNCATGSSGALYQRSPKS